MRSRPYLSCMYGGINRSVCVRRAFDIRTHPQDLTMVGRVQWSSGHRSLWCLRLLACRPRTPSQQLLRHFQSTNLISNLALLVELSQMEKELNTSAGSGCLEFNLGLNEDHG